MKALRWIGATIVAVGVSAAWAADETCPFKTAKGKSVCAVKAATCAAKVQAEAVDAVISTDALSALLRSGVDLKVLDARSAKYDDGRRIPGAESLTASASAEQIAAVAGTDKSALIVTYCASTKCPASKHLATKLRKLGYVNVIEYPEGIAGWAAANKTVVKVGT